MSLVLWLPLNGNIENQGLSNFSVTSPDAVSSVSGKTGSCMKIVSNTELGYTPDFSNNSLSLCGWFKFNKDEINEVITGLTYTSKAIAATGNLIGNSTYGGIGIIWTANDYYSTSAFTGIRIIGSLRTPTVIQTTGALDIEFGVWIHIAVVWDVDERKLNLYKNGVQISSVNVNGFTDGVVKSLKLNYRSVWGGNGPAANIPLYVNDVRIYDHALSQKEVKELSKGLIAHYKLENHKIKNIFSYPTFNTSSSAGGWSHWGGTGHIGSYSQNTDKNYIWDKRKTYSHRVANGEGATYKYLVYQSPAYDTTISSGGYRTMVAIIKETSGKPITEDVCHPACNAPVAASSLTPLSKWTSVTNIGDDFYLCKYEGVYQNGTNNLIGINIPAGQEIYLSECYLENYAQVTGYMYGPEKDIMEDASGNGRHGEYSGTVYAVRTVIGGRNTSAIENGDGYIGKAMVNMPPSEQITFSWWGNYKSFGHQTSGLFSTSDNETSQPDYYSTACNMYDDHFRMCNTDGVVKSLASTGKELNVWHHYCVTYDGSMLRFYVDGVVKASTAQTGMLKGFKYLFISHSKAGGVERNCIGDVSDFRIYCTALNISEIEELANVSSSIDKKGNIFCYELKEE